MSYDEFDDNCPGCRPAILDVKTGKVLPDDAPMMQAALGVWRTATTEEKRAFHRFCCFNSRDPEDVRLASGIAQRIEKALAN